MIRPVGASPSTESGPKGAAAGHPPRVFKVPLPRTLRRFASAVRASILGADHAPLVIVLGGISADWFPCRTPDGAPGWWHGLTDESGGVNPRDFRILGIEFAADDAGCIAPSTRDQAEVICAVLDAIGVEQAHGFVGASYGGMAALSLAQHFPGRVAKLAIVSAPADPHPMSTAARELQRRIVALGLANGAAADGLALARGLAMLTYRSPAEFEKRFASGIDSEDALARSQAGAYIHARGEAFHSIMSPGRFISLSASIDRHRVDPEQIDVPALLIGSTTDQLVPPSQMVALANRYAGPVNLNILPSLYGHDMFLKEAAQVSALVGPFLRSST